MQFKKPDLTHIIPSSLNDKCVWDITGTFTISGGNFSKDPLSALNVVTFLSDTEFKCDDLEISGPVAIIVPDGVKVTFSPREGSDD